MDGLKVDREGLTKLVQKSRKKFGVNIRTRANFPCFSQKKDSSISSFLKIYSPKFYSIKLFYPKNHQNFIYTNIQYSET